MFVKKSKFSHNQFHIKYPKDMGFKKYYKPNSNY